MAGYLVFDIKITDPDAWEEYRSAAGPVMTRSGGEFVMTSKQIVPLEGGWHPRSLSVVKFTSFDAAKTFYHSEAYQALVPLRERASESCGVLVEST